MKKKCKTHSHISGGNKCLNSLSYFFDNQLKQTAITSKMGIIKSRPCLTNDDLLFLKSYAGRDKDLIRKWCKLFKKNCPNGRITPTAFISICEMFFPYINAELFSAYIFKAFDNTQNGYIDFKELIQAIGDNFLVPTSNGTTIGVTSEEKLLWAFLVRDMWLVMARLIKIFK